MVLVELQAVGITFLTDRSARNKALVTEWSAEDPKVFNKRVSSLRRGRKKGSKNTKKIVGKKFVKRSVGLSDSDNESVHRLATRNELAEFDRMLNLETVPKRSVIDLECHPDYEPLVLSKPKKQNKLIIQAEVEKELYDYKEDKLNDSLKRTYPKRNRKKRVI